MQSIKAEKDIILKHKRNGELYRALLNDKTKKVKKECAKVDEQGLHILTIHDDTVLHAATYSRKSRLVLDLLEALPPDHLDKMTRQNHQGNTILHDAATSDNLDVAQKVLEKAPGLLSMRNHLGETALFRSVRYGKEKIFNFLLEKISSYSEANQQLFLWRSDKTTILHVAILAHHFDLALKIAEKFKYLVNERDADGMTSLQHLSCNPGAFLREDKVEFLQNIFNSIRLHCSSAIQSKVEEQETTRYESAMKLAKFLIEKDFSWEATYPGIDMSKPTLHKYGTGSHSVEKGVGQAPGLLMTSLGQRDQPDTTTPLFLATKSGCIDIAEEILNCYPQAIEHIDEKGRNILHIAIKYRQLKIFELVKGYEVPMKRLVRKVDDEGNSILHTVGIKMADYIPEKLRGPALELREEMLWFERVKSVTPPHFVDHRNDMKLTADGLFYQANNELRTAATEWLKRTAEGCTVVAVLIATVAFAAAYTVPGGPNSQTGAPLLVNKPFFVVFTVTDVLSLSFALTSVVIFLSIVSSPFRLPDFKESLPTKLMLGFTFLFLSVFMMMVAFAATVLLMIQNRENWTKVILYALSFLPVGIFALSYFPLYLSLSETFKYLLWKLGKAIPRAFLFQCYQV
ncbi:ankyrin repeat-containing protein At5g02620-like [Juglans microcarpa x Juglans regia]|uniref:ankyrin repeat-containing protein At5g02620-like n=1 Tax=Juglans microcarpa x Juglans regia TaxID=2249226 RepID=UPI001B7E06C6|nr:ankyrin repeat-containing protein At5g02620-like [Juglans microcarpa x Juglans regia]